MANLPVVEDWQIGGQIKRVRRLSGLSGRQLNLLIGESNNLLSHMEDGKRITHQRIVRIANECAGKGGLTDDAGLIVQFIYELAESSEIAPPPGKGPRIPVDRSKIEEFCRKWKIREFSFFGSVLTGDFGPDSDIDVLVTFEEDASWGWEIVDMHDELEEMFGRSVDFLERRGVEASKNPIRRKSILEGTKRYLVRG